MGKEKQESLQVAFLFFFTSLFREKAERSNLKA